MALFGVGTHTQGTQERSSLSTQYIHKKSTALEQGTVCDTVRGVKCGGGSVRVHREIS